MINQTINQLAMEVKINGLRSNKGQEAFNELYTMIEKDIRLVVKNFMATEEHKNMNLDEDELFSHASWEGMQNAIKDYDIKKGDFLGRYKSFINYALNNGVTYQMKNSIKSMVTSISVELPSKSNSEIRIADTLIDTSDAYRHDYVDQLLAGFGKQYGRDKAHVMEILTFIDGQAQKTSALCKVFGVSEYSTTIRKRVQRIRADFKKYCKVEGFLN